MQTITNFRDLGGLKTLDGQRIRSKKVLRSGELSRLSTEDATQLSSIYHLEKVVDLRSLSEIDERPDKLVQESQYIHIDIFKDIPDEGTGLNEFIRLGSVEEAQHFMHTMYKQMTTNTTAQQGFAQTIELAATISEKGSFLFHCFAGKDRTGITAALFLEILGIPRSDIFSDYLQTNLLRVNENKQFRDAARANGATTTSLQTLDVALTVDPSYLDTFYQTIEELYGGVQNYLTHLQISPSLQKDLRSQFLVN